LRNYTNFDTLRVLGLDGADTFNVTTLGHRPQPQSVRGRFALGREKSIDNSSTPPPRPRISQSAATQDPDAG
jgi:hypothetical protein